MDLARACSEVRTSFAGVRAKGEGGFLFSGRLPRLDRPVVLPEQTYKPYMLPEAIEFPWACHGHVENAAHRGTKEARGQS